MPATVAGCPKLSLCACQGCYCPAASVCRPDLPPKLLCCVQLSPLCCSLTRLEVPAAALPPLPEKKRASVSGSVPRCTEHLAPASHGDLDATTSTQSTESTMHVRVESSRENESSTRGGEREAPMGFLVGLSYFFTKLVSCEESLSSNSLITELLTQQDDSLTGDQVAPATLPSSCPTPEISSKLLRC